MIVNVNPGKNFAGIVGLQSATGFCDILPVNNLLTNSEPFILAAGRNRWEGYAAELRFSKDPCGGYPVVTSNGTSTTYTYDVLVQYDVMSMSPGLDELVTFSCTVSNAPISSGVNEVWALRLVIGRALLIGQLVFRFESRTAVLFSVTDEQGVPIESPKLGAVVTISFSVDPSSIFEDIAVKSCTVYDSMRMNYRQVVVDSCAVPPFGRSLVKGGKGRNSLKLVIYKFSNDPRLSFECQVKVCMPNDYTCVMYAIENTSENIFPQKKANTGTASGFSILEARTWTSQRSHGENNSYKLLGIQLNLSEPPSDKGNREQNPTLCDAMTGQMMGTFGTAGTGRPSATGPLPGAGSTDPLASLMGGMDLTSLTNLLTTGRKKRAADSGHDNIVIVGGNLGTM
ncbi:hypothetical protein BaRGS_00013117, partial [Batillaria attramentaria]